MREHSLLVWHPLSRCAGQSLLRCVKHRLQAGMAWHGAKREGRARLWRRVTQSRSAAASRAAMRCCSASAATGWVCSHACSAWPTPGNCTTYTLRAALAARP